MKKKNWVVVALCIAIVGMGIGFAALAQNLQISATANITGEWDVRIINEVWQGPSNRWGGPKDMGTVSFDGTSATVQIELEFPGSFFEVVLEVQNFGNIDAILNSITGVTAANSSEPSEIQFSVRVYDLDSDDMTPLSIEDTTVGSRLPAGTTHNIRVRAEWLAAPDGETVIPDITSKTATINFNYVQAT